MTRTVKLTKDEAVAMVLAAAEILRSGRLDKDTKESVMSSVEKLNHAFNLGIEKS